MTLFAQCLFQCYENLSVVWKLKWGTHWYTDRQTDREHGDIASWIFFRHKGNSARYNRVISVSLSSNKTDIEGEARDRTKRRALCATVTGERDKHANRDVASTCCCWLCMTYRMKHSHTTFAQCRAPLIKYATFSNSLWRHVTIGGYSGNILLLFFHSSGRHSLSSRNVGMFCFIVSCQALT